MELLRLNEQIETEYAVKTFEVFHIDAHGLKIQLRVIFG